MFLIINVSTNDNNYFSYCHPKGYKNLLIMPESYTIENSVL